MGEYTQDSRFIAINTPLGKDVLLLQSFKGSEGISQLFQFDLHMHSENHAIDLAALVGKQATIRITLADGSQRFINGLVNTFSQGGSSTTFAHYHATLVPWLWMLTRTSDCRIFQNKTVTDIVSQVFRDCGFRDFKLKLQGSYPEREYCVQYRETAFNFVSRLMEEEGIFYFFEHEADKHTLVLADNPNAIQPCPNQAEARFETVAAGHREEDIVTEWSVAKEVRPSKYRVNDFDFEKPSTNLTASVDGMIAGMFEIYDYPGEYKTKSEGERLVGIRMQEEEAPATVITGSSDCRAFTSGYRFDLKEHYRRDLNKAYTLTAIHHTASQGANYRASAEDALADFRYVNRFQCVPHPSPFRPARTAPVPVIHGTQTAIVVGPSGEEIYVDKYGRVKVQFHWDREGKYDQNSSCWVRVSQNWAGKRWGAMFIPRIGQEVIVDFLEGDPDRPIITGRVYNGASMPPYELGKESTKSTIKSNSSKGGGGFNELRFEDKKGSEQVFIHAQKNQDIRVKNDLMEWVGNDSHLIVKKNQLEDISGNYNLQVKGNQNEKVDGGVSLKVGMAHQEKVGMKYAVDAGMEIHLKGGMTVVVEAGVSLTLKVGGNFINMNPAGVFIQGTMVMINSGGAAGAGSGASPTPPMAPREADTGEPGQKEEMPPPKEPRKPVTYSPGALAMKWAAQMGLPVSPV
jgi:type VI secretion system secreted protein VgrG